MKAMRGPLMDPAWTPHGPVGGAPEMDYTGEAMRGPRMDPWGGAPEMGCAKKAMRGPRMDPWGGAPGMGCVVKAMRGPRMDPAWTREWRQSVLLLFFFTARNRQIHWPAFGQYGLSRKLPAAGAKFYF